jgi:phosphatidylserine/phosphatidylglycerophosphate/cardiolipin synthase-like enzyme
MMVSEGPVAGALFDLAAERWLRATGEALPPPPPTDHELWPAHVTADVTEADVGIARTEPAWAGRETVDEALQLSLELIRAAKHTLYIENQYFTAPPIAEAIAARLAEPDGPEIVLVSTGQSPSWFDRATMDRARAVLVWRLRSADIFQRFRAWRPVTIGGQTVIVHSKVMVVDDRVARIGSANLNNRSGGFDTECDLAVEAQNPEQAAAIERLRDGLVAHFIGRTVKDMADARARHGGFIAAVEALNRAGRLAPIEPEKMGAFGEFVAAHHLGDPTTTEDSWRPFRRRERLYSTARADQAPAAISTTSGR